MSPERDDSAFEDWPMPSREVLRQLERGPVWPAEDQAPPAGGAPTSSAPLRTS